MLTGVAAAQAGGAKGPLFAYVGTFSSPLRDVLPTQVDLPPGHGRGISTSILTAIRFIPSRMEGSNLVLFDYDAALGRLTPRQTICSLPPGFAGSNFCSEILLPADGRFLHAGNRLHDSIAIFSIGGNRTLTYLREEWTRGNYPHSFNFDPSGQFLYSCNQRGDNITTFRVDPQSGCLRVHRPLHPGRQSFHHRFPRSRTGRPVNATPAGQARVSSGRGAGRAASPIHQTISPPIPFRDPGQRWRILRFAKPPIAAIIRQKRRARPAAIETKQQTRNPTS